MDSTIHPSLGSLYLLGIMNNEEDDKKTPGAMLCHAMPRKIAM